MTIIETESSSTDSDTNKYDTVKLMENKNPIIKLMMFGKIKRIVGSYQNVKLKQIDK